MDNLISLFLGPVDLLVFLGLIAVIFSGAFILFDLGEGSFASVVDGLEGLVRSRAHRLADAVRTLGRQRTREGRKEEENDKSGGGETAPHGMG